jgi:hypothetical protein
VRIRCAIIGIGVVFAASAGIAHADETKSISRALKAPNAATPWYEQFTASNGEPARAASGASDQTVTGMVTAKWGFSLNLKDADRTRTVARDETAVGAFYDFTPRIRVGGELRVADPVAAGAPPGRRSGAAETGAGVKLESAFRF